MSQLRSRTREGINSYECPVETTCYLVTLLPCYLLEVMPTLRTTPMATTLARRRRTPMRTMPRMDGAANMKAKVATDRLTGALLAMAARGERTHCSDPAIHYLWLSEHDNERVVAVMLCDHCPVLQVCRDTAEQRDERWGVWGGVD